MTREEFKAKAKAIIDNETFGSLGKLFGYESFEEMKVAHIPDDLCSTEADMPLDDFLDELYESLEQEPSEDCVSRQAVIDKKVLVELEDGQSFYCISPEDVEELPPVTPTQKWIPVSERLPKSSGVYIVSRWFSDGEERAILVDANYYDGNGCWYNDNRINWGRNLVTNRIVAWMPLPEPYNAERER